RERLESSRDYIISLAGLESLDWLDPGDAVPECATSLVGDMKVLVPLGDIIDKDTEDQRLQRELQKTRENLERAYSKLANPSFVERAPKNIVEQERQRVKEFEAALKNLDAQL
ncbi:MAG: valine--tRNA ligase, partial [Burkholderiales bacterium]|nr:valine--tRNA ligase [Burkholderiales bacterium]